MEKKIVTLDLTGCKYLGEVHQRIRKTFDFPEWYGENWDAFYDLLRTECAADKIVVCGEHTLPEDFSDEIKIMHKVLEDTHLFHARLHHTLEYEILD